MNRLAFPVVLVLYLVFLAHEARADVLAHSGADCTAIRPGQSKQLEWSFQGITNPSPTNSLYVLCPFERQEVSVDTAVQPWWGGGIVLARGDAENPAEVACQFREMVGSRRVRLVTRKVTLAANTQWRLGLYQTQTASALSTYHVSCKLPPKTTISTLFSAATANKDNRLINAFLDAAAAQP